MEGYDGLVALDYDGLICNVNISRKRRGYVNCLRADMVNFYSEVLASLNDIITIYNALEAPNQYSI